MYIYMYMFIHCGALGPWHSFLLHPLLDLDEVVLVHWNTAQSTMARLSEPRPPRDGPTSEGHSNSCWACPHPQGCRSGSASSPPWPDRSSSDLAKCPWGTRMIKGDILMCSILIYIIYNICTVHKIRPLIFLFTASLRDLIMSCDSSPRSPILSNVLGSSPSQ